MAESTISVIEDPDIREELSDKLEKYVYGASEEVVRLAYDTGEVAFESLGAPEDFKKKVDEILMENIYIPMMLGADKHKS